jgi:hypothetical protein
MTPKQVEEAVSKGVVAGVAEATKQVTDTKRVAPKGHAWKPWAAGVAASLVVGTLGYLGNSYVGQGEEVDSNKAAITSLKNQTKDITRERIVRIETEQESLEGDVGSMQADVKATRTVVDRIAGRLGVKAD